MAEVPLVGGEPSTLDQQPRPAELSHALNLPGHLAVVSPSSVSPVSAGGTAEALAGSVPCSSWSLSVCVSGSPWCHQAPGLHPHSTPTCPVPPPRCAGSLPSQPWLLVSQAEMKINSTEGSFNFLYSSENKCAFPTTRPCKFPAL